MSETLEAVATTSANTSDTNSKTVFNPLQEGYMDDPYPHQAEMREHAPVQKSGPGQWTLFRYRDMQGLLKDPALSVSDDMLDPEAQDPEQAMMFFKIMQEVYGEDGGFELKTTMQGMDAPDHTRLRRLVSKAFTNRSIEQLRPSIQQKVDAALDKMETSETTDVMDNMAYPIPFEVISDMLGMPKEDQLALRHWSELIVTTVDPVLATEDDIRAAMIAERDMSAHLDKVIAWKMENLGDDLLTAMIRAREGDDRLTAAELRDQVAVLFVAGHETAVNLIGTGLYELLRNRDQYELLCNDPDIVKTTAIDELLRFVSPITFTRRVTTSELTINGHTIPVGSALMACLASANRDPDYWGPTAHKLNLTRDMARHHLAFGSGSHRCVGATLAKLEGQVALSTFAKRYPNAQLAGEPVWNGRINLRGISRLPVQLNP